MKYILASDLFKYSGNIKPFLFGVLFSRIKKVNSDLFYFCGYTAVKVSKALLQYDFEKCADELVEKYNVESGYDNWTVHNVNKKAIKKEQEPALELRFYIKNDIDLKISTFNNTIYKLLMKCEWLYDNEFNENKKAFVRGFMETRGSIDTSAKFISQDYYYDNKIELNRIFIFSNQIGIPVQYLNFNIRDTQPNSKEKNTQFRINLFWYASEIGFINKYKAEIFKNAYASQINDTYSANDITYSLVGIPKMSDKVTFNKMHTFYSNKVFQRKLTSQQVEILRNELGFSEKTANGKPTRNQSLRIIFDNLEEDKCALCGTTKTYKKPNGRQYFETHHMIGVHNEQKYDNLGNFVKLCPTCHNSFKKNRADKTEQLTNIKTVLQNKPEVFNYTSAALGEDNLDKLSEIIFNMLG